MAERNPEQKRSRLLQSAMRMFNRYGASVPIAKISEDAGVAGGTPFLYFASKEELLRTAFIQTIEQGKARIYAGIDWSAPVRCVIAQIVGNFLRWAYDSPMEEEFTQKYIDVYHYDYFGPSFETLRAELLSDDRILSRLRGEVNGDCPLELLIRYVTIQITAFARYIIHYREQIDFDAFSKLAADMIWNSIRAHGDGKVDF